MNGKAKVPCGLIMPHFQVAITDSYKGFWAKIKVAGNQAWILWSVKQFLTSAINASTSLFDRPRSVR